MSAEGPLVKAAARRALGLLAAVSAAVAAALAASAALASQAHAVTPPARSATAVPGDALRGQVLYETGRRADGSAPVAVRPAAGRVPAVDAACAHCHRSSGMGQRQGPVLVPALAGHILFAPLHRPTMVRAYPGLKRVPLRAYDRPAYTSAAFAAALRQGVDVAGRPLQAVMPRYALNAQDAADLEAHLRALSERPLPGVAGGVLNLATVIAPDAPPTTRHTVDRAVGAWAQQLSLGGWQVRWSAWRLSGPADGWAAQLQQLWQAQPVFALVSGAGGTQWAPVARFCEAHKIPCVFPSLEALPAGADKAHFNFYLSGGVQAEASILARWAPQAVPPPRRVVQLLAAQEPAAALAAKVLQRALPAGLAGATEHCGQTGSAAPEAARAYAAAQSGDVLVLWARSDAVSAFLKSAPPRPGVRLWLSATLAPPHRVQVPAAWRSLVSWASVHSDAVRRDAGGTLSVAPWARMLQLPADMDPVVLTEVYAATFFFTDALARMREGLNAEYFNERLEDTVDLRPASAGFFRMSLGPHQRIAAQGGHMLGYDGQGGAPLKPVSPFLRADAPPALP